MIEGVEEPHHLVAQSDKGIMATVDRSVIEYEDASNVYDHLLEEQETLNKPLRVFPP